MHAGKDCQPPAGLPGEYFGWTVSESTILGPKTLTEDCESEDHVLHDFITQNAAPTLRCIYSGLQVALVHPDLHLLYLLHFVGTENSEEELTLNIDMLFLCLYQIGLRETHYSPMEETQLLCISLCVFNWKAVQDDL